MSTNLYDVGLRQALLRTILKEDLPDDNNNNTKISHWDGNKLLKVVETVQTFNLLSESSSAVGLNDSKLIERWKSSVDDWVSRLLSLVSNSSQLPEKCWAGICLLGITCRECSSDRFLASYTLWFDKLLLHVQSPSDSQFIKVASCSSLSDLITRLAGFSNVKKDGTSYAGKLIQPILKLFQEVSSETVWEAAINLLSTVIICFPAAVHRNYDSAEAVIASKIVSRKCGGNMLKKFAYCLAILPKSRGDEESWNSMMRKILLLVNGYLTGIFHGLEAETKWDEAVRLLVPPGEAIPTAVWGQNLLEETSDKSRKRLMLSCVAALMLSCCTMLTTSYPSQVIVPARSLLALIERVLMVDGSLSRGSSIFVIATEQEFICSELPCLYSHSLELLTSVIKGMRSQLLPHAAYIVRLIKEYFKRCQLQELRIKTYSITKMLLISMGVGIATFLAPEVVNNSFLDLNPATDGTLSSATSKVSSNSLLQPCHRKRKHGATGLSEQNSDQLNLELEAFKSHFATQSPLKIAALGALEALLTVGGALKSESWRSKVENLLITLAEDSCKSVWAQDERNTFLANVLNSTELQVAVLRALLASLLSPSRVRPPHLAQSLELFRRGRQETGTKISEFCSHALLALEVLIHPRTLPMTDLSSVNLSHEESHGFRETMFSGGEKHNTTFSTRMQGIGNGASESDDDLYDSWLGTTKETDTSDKNAKSERPLENLSVHQAKQTLTPGSLDAEVPRQVELEPAEASPSTNLGTFSDEVILKSREVKESDPQLQALSSSAVLTVPGLTDGTSVLNSKSNETTPLDAAMTNKGIKSAPAPASGVASFSVLDATTSHFDSDDSSDESLPDIVDVEPDSD